MAQSGGVVLVMMLVLGQQVGGGLLLVVVMLGEEAVAGKGWGDRGGGGNVRRGLLEAGLERFGRRSLVMVLGKGRVEASGDGNVLGGLLHLVLAGQKLMLHGGQRHSVGGCHDGSGLHVRLNGRRQPGRQATLPGEKLGIPPLALGDGVDPIGTRGFLVVPLLLLPVLLLLLGKEVGVPALAVGDGLALDDLVLKDRLQLRPALLDADEVALDEADASALGKAGEAGATGDGSRKLRGRRACKVHGSGRGRHLWLGRHVGSLKMDLGGVNLAHDGRGSGRGRGSGSGTDRNPLLLPQLDGAGHVELPLGVQVLLHELLEAVGLLHPHEGVGIDAAVQFGTAVPNLLLADHVVAQLRLVAAELPVEEGVDVRALGDLAEAPPVQLAGEGGELASAEVLRQDLVGELGRVVDEEAPAVGEPRDGRSDGLVRQHLHEALGEARDFRSRGRRRVCRCRRRSCLGLKKCGGDRPLAEREGPAELLAPPLLGRETSPSPHAMRVSGKSGSGSGSSRGGRSHSRLLPPGGEAGGDGSEAEKGRGRVHVGVASHRWCVGLGHGGLVGCCCC
mmetsp:Transcript_10594/g.29794  ORF Transcript_10594/g.29794 Transcript_10594/m.29794 type:complete len:563 (+) Transcript_10594:135-1823(+)